MKRLMAHWVLHACTEVQKNTSITTKAWRHLSWTFEDTPRLAARAAREHLKGTLFEETEEDTRRSHRRKRTSSSMTTTMMKMLRIPRARGQLLQKPLQLLQKHLSRFRQCLPKSHAQDASCIFAARTASIHQSHELLSGTMQDRRCACIVPTMR